jgi:hypothetical protein
MRQAWDDKWLPGGIKNIKTWTGASILKIGFAGIANDDE